MTYTLRYATYTKYVDIETGEVITKEDATKNYTQIKISKHVKLNKQQTTKIAQYTITCRRKPEQLKLY